MRVKLGGVLFAVAVVLVLVVGQRQPRLPGALGLMYARVRIGMTWDEAANLLAVSGEDNSEEKFAFAVLHDGSEFHGMLWDPDVPAMQRLPASDQVEEGYLEMCDEDGR